MVRLAEGDGHEWKQYPDFDKFFDSLGTKLSKEDVRLYLRYYLRERVCDDRKKTFPARGSSSSATTRRTTSSRPRCAPVLEKMGKKPSDVPEYATFDRVVDAGDGGSAKGEKSQRGN